MEISKTSRLPYRMNILVNRATAHAVTFIFGLMLLAVYPGSWAHADAAAQLELADEAVAIGAFSEALEQYLPLAEDGEPNAMMGLYELYKKGWGVEQNEVKATEWVTHARKIWEDRARKNDPRAHLALGAIYHKGQGVEVNRRLSRDHLGKALEYAIERGNAGDPEGQYIVGYLYTAGKTRVNDPLKGIAWLESAATKGYRKALKLLVYLYECACHGVPPNEERAAYWRIKLNAP